MQRGIILSVFMLCFGPALLAQNAAPAAITVLSVIGDITYFRPDFQSPLPVQVGQLILATDEVVSSADGVLQVLCPDGIPAEFLADAMTANHTLPCPTNGVRIGEQGMAVLRNQKGGRQDPTIPYLIAPRATLLRTPNVTLIWNAPLDVENYTLTVRAGSEIVWTSDKLLPADVVSSGMAQKALPVELQPNKPYTVNICVLFTTLQQGCTSDAGWAAGVDVAFYYAPDADLDRQLAALDSAFGQNSAEARYAQAVLLYQPVAAYSKPGKSMGYYAEAIALLEAMLKENPDHPLSKSPATLNLLGELYRSTNLPLSAARAYQRGVVLTTPLPITEPATISLMGSGMTTPAGDEVDYYSRALNTAMGYLTPEAFISHFEQTCSIIGDICLDLPECSTAPGADCQAWYRK